MLLKLKEFFRKLFTGKTDSKDIAISTEPGIQDIDINEQCLKSFEWLYCFIFIHGNTVILPTEYDIVQVNKQQQLATLKDNTWTTNPNVIFYGVYRPTRRLFAANNWRIHFFGSLEDMLTIPEEAGFITQTGITPAFIWDKIADRVSFGD